MDNAKLYANANTFQTKDAEDVLKEYLHLVKISKGNAGKILDVGCGDGKVTMDILYKNLPTKNIEQILGTDISPKMIKYAEANYSSDLIDFQVMDISAKIEDRLQNQFDHVFSFNCLHWVQNQRVAMKNIYNLLRTNGDCLISFQAKNHIFDIYQNLAKNPRWSQYMSDCSKFISPYHFSEDPTQQCRRTMEEAGFSHVFVETKAKQFYYYGQKSLKESVKAVCPFLQRIPANLHDQYLDDYIEEAKHLNLIEEGNNNEGEEIIIRSPYLLTVCYAVK